MFWELTLREIEIVLSGFQEGQFQNYCLAYYTAYNSGKFSQPYDKGKFPKFSDNQPKRDKKAAFVRKSPAELLKKFELFNAAIGGSDARKK